MRSALRIFVFIAVVSLTGCTIAGDDRSSDEWEASFYDGNNHPQLENLPYSIDLPERSRGGGRSVELREHIERLMETEAVIVGDEEEDSSVLFGTITNVSSDGQEIYVSDNRNNRVVVLASDGRLVDVLGEPGEGPGEFSQVYDVFPDEDGLIVLDAARRFSLWSTSDEGYELHEHRNYQMVTRSACRLGDDFIIHMPVPNRGLIHVFDSEGEEVRSFGELYQSENALVADIMSSSRVACVEDSDTIVVAYRALSIMTAFNRQGNVLWSVPLLDVPPRRQEVMRGGRSIQYREEGSERSISTLTHHPGYGLVMTVFDMQEEADIGLSYDVFYVDVTTGAREHVTTLPADLHAVSDSFVVLSSSQPAPVVSIYGANH